eukprot:TRINITY_DN598_c0_g2_i3.p2 TRINITY_DN598_c0_g2~~TRINITY_DN598_c0_g2_i3.p2  ORF type:complete len:171 (+),score=39.79 TRINITY_DN598_c0_g2_i3:75-587(+)
MLKLKQWYQRRVRGDASQCNEITVQDETFHYSTQCLPKADFDVAGGVAVFSYESPRCEPLTEQSVNWLRSVDCKQLVIFDPDWYGVECDGDYVRTKFNCREGCGLCAENATFPISTCFDGKQYECGLLSSFSSPPLPPWSSVLSYQPRPCPYVPLVVAPLVLLAFLVLLV